MFFLMVKTHNKTGLKYLCQTKRKNPFKYSGSGMKWRQHLKKHGENIKTEIIGIFETKEELREAGIHYSNLWNVSSSKEWANLKIEEGDGGDVSHLDSWKNGMTKRRSYKGKNNPNYGKTGYWKGKVGKMLDHKWWNNGSSEILSKDCPKDYVSGRILYACPHCDKSVNYMNKKWHFDHCKKHQNGIKTISHLIGMKWWNNGKTEKKFKEFPGEGWIRGSLRKI